MLQCLDMAMAVDPKSELTHGRLLVFDTHPIQYRSPVFRALFQKHPHSHVCFFNDSFDGNKWWFNEVGKIPHQNWELELKHGFPNETIGTKKLGFLGSYRALKKILETQVPAAVVIYGYYQPEHWMLWWLCRRLGIALIFIGESFTRGGSIPRRILKKFIQPVFFNSVSQVVAIGEKTRAFYESLRVEPFRMTGAKYCVDVSFFALSQGASEETRQRVRKDLDIPSEAFVQLFVGRLFERKRPWDMLELHRKLSQLSKVYTVIVGNGNLEENLRAKAKREERILILGFRNQSETRELYHASDLLIVPSEFESWGLVVNEAFACRLPAIVTDTCGVADDLVIHGETGFIYKVGELETAAELVRRLLEDPKEHARLRKNVYSKVTNDYRVEQFAEAMLEAFRKAIIKT